MILRSFAAGLYVIHVIVSVRNKYIQNAREFRKCAQNCNTIYIVDNLIRNLSDLSESDRFLVSKRNITPVSANNSIN